MHFNPDTGEEDDAQAPGQERCVRACYDCLLSYANQSVHELIDRHLVRDLMLRLASATVAKPEAEDQEPGNPERTNLTPAQSVSAEPDDTLEAGFVAWLGTRGLRQPDAIGEEVFGVCPDLIYRLKDNGVAVFFDDEDRDWHEVLRDEGWGVIRIESDADWETVVGRYPSVFGGMQEGAQ